MQACVKDSIKENVLEYNFIFVNIKMDDIYKGCNL